MGLRVLHAPGAGAGNPGCLAKAERAVGLQSWCLTTDANPFAYQVDEYVPGPEFGRVSFELQRFRLLTRALRNFDVIHFNYGRTFFPNALQLDLPLLKAAGKRIFMTYQGDDARQGDVCREKFDVTFATRVAPEYYTPETDSAKRRGIAWVARFVDGIYALNPDLLHVLPESAQFMPYANVDIAEWVPSFKVRNDVPVIVHAPTHRAVKGTDVVLAAIDRLRGEGLQCELLLIEGMTRAQARQAYERADLAIDQLFAGWYGGFAVEMMALGKPVLSYLRESDMQYLPPAMRAELPVISVRPENVVQVLRSVLAFSQTELDAVGRRSRSFVETWHDPVKVAMRLKADYEATA